MVSATNRSQTAIERGKWKKLFTNLMKYTETCLKLAFSKQIGDGCFTMHFFVWAVKSPQ
jgi:hypothetical protein